MTNFNDGSYVPPQSAPQVSVKKSHKIRNFVVLPFAGLIAIIVATNAGGSSTSTSVTPQAAPVVATEAPVGPNVTCPVCPNYVGPSIPKPAPAAPVATAVVVPKVAPKPTAAPLTVEQENAVQSAKDYLEFSAFSRKGLIQQLSSDAGSGYPVKVATFAVDSLHINYNEQAAKAAKEYLATGPFSRSGLIEQLSSDAGSGFTHSQAVYGVNKAGL